MHEKSYGFHRFSSRLQYSFLNICFSSVFCRQNANRYLVCFGTSSIHEVMISLLNLPYMTCVFLSLYLQSWIIFIQWYVFRTCFVVTMPTDIAFILGCAVFMKLSWINQISISQLHRMVEDINIIISTKSLSVKPLKVQWDPHGWIAYESGGPFRPMENWKRLLRYSETRSRPSTWKADCKSSYSSHPVYKKTKNWYSQLWPLVWCYIEHRKVLTFTDFRWETTRRLWPL